MEAQIIAERENVVLDSEPLGLCASALVLETVGLSSSPLLFPGRL